MAKTEGGLCLCHCVSCLNDILQQVALAEGHDAFGER